jgi:hypothetical protein
MASTIVPKNIDDCKLNYPIASKEATPVEFCGSMGERLLTELSSIPLNKRVEECIVDVKKAFPYGDIDLVRFM